MAESVSCLHRPAPPCALAADMQQFGLRVCLINATAQESQTQVILLQPIDLSVFTQQCLNQTLA